MVYEQVLSHEVVLGNRVYQNPLKYYQIQDNISLDGGVMSYLRAMKD